MVYTLGDIGNVPGQAFDFLKRQAGRFVNLTKPGEDDGDYTTRSAAIARQRKLADMLSQMGEQEQAVSTAGGITAPMSGMGALARGLTSFGGAYLSGKASADEAAATKAEKAAIQSGFADIFKRGDLVEQGAQQPDDAEGIPQYAANTQVGGGKYILTPEDQQRRLIGLVGDHPGAAGQANLYSNLIGDERARADAERDRNQPNMVAAGANGMIDSNPRSSTYGQRFAVPPPDRPPVPGRMILGDRVYAENPDGTPGADLGPAPTGGGTKVDITMPPGPKKADEIIGEMYAQYVTGDNASGAKDMNQLAAAINYMQQDPEMFGSPTGILPIKIRSLFPSLKEGANVQQMIQDVVQKNLRRILGPQFTAREGEGLMDRITDAQQPTGVNIDRAMRFLQAIQEASQAKDDVMRYFGKNNTITGYIPKFAMASTLDDIIFNAENYGVDATGQARNPTGRAPLAGTPPPAQGGAGSPPEYVRVNGRLQLKAPLKAP